ncbi:ankyrin repeat-containing domain protein [Jackrogersella minutella]|nr:ankyrin repeat-containing domain protein [Jackrogersella minutella]
MCENCCQVPITICHIKTSAAPALKFCNSIHHLKLLLPQAPYQIMATFNSLPNEVLLMIAAYLSFGHTYHHKHLAALASTSRHMYHLINPALYRYSEDDGSCVLHWAITYGRIETLEKAFIFGLYIGPQTYPSSHDNCKPHSLLLAVLRDREAVVTWLLDHEVDVNYGLRITDIGVDARHSPLHFALISGQASVALLLIDQGACLEFSWPVRPYITEDDMPRPCSAMHVASENGLVSVVKHLVRNKGIDINIPDSDGKTCLHYAARGKDSPTIIEELVQLGADVNGGVDTDSPLCYAIEEENFKQALALIDAGADIQRPSPLLPVQICTLTGLSFKDKVDDHRQSDYISLLTKLIDLSKDADERCWESILPILLKNAITGGTAEALSMILLEGAEADQEIEGIWPMDWLWNSCFCHDKYVMEDSLLKTKLLLRGNARLDQLSTGFCSTALEKALHLSREIMDPAPLISLLDLVTDKTASPEHIDELLELAILYRDWDCCRILREYGARLRDDLTTVAGWAEEALRARKQCDNFRNDYVGCRGFDDSDIESFMTLLLSFGLGFDELDQLFRMALEYQDSMIATIFLNHGITGRRRGLYDPNEWLQGAATWGHMGIMRRLLQGSPDVNGYDSEGELPLSRAVQAGHTNAVLLLMDHGADAHKISRSSTEVDCLKPVQHAIRRGQIAILEDILTVQPRRLSKKEMWIPIILRTAPAILSFLENHGYFTVYDSSIDS